MNLTKISEIKPLMEKHGFIFSKSLGQNFLISKDIPLKIAECSGVDTNTVVLEIGPGIGCLTYELAKRAKKVIAVEIDKSLIPILHETLAEYDNIEIINSDILKLDLYALCSPYENLIVCANLPYYITTPIIMSILEHHLNIKSITVMVQKEVAQRLCAKAADKDYGAITAAVSYYSHPEIMFGVPAGCFMPAPKVDSAVIKLNLIPRKCDDSLEKIVFKIIRAGFDQRRKILANSLSKSLSITKEQAFDAIENIGLRPDIRPEMLDIDMFIKLAGQIVESGFMK